MDYFGLMNKLTIFKRLFWSFFLVALCSFVAFGVLFYTHQKEALIARTTAQLRSVNILKKSMIEARLHDDEKFIWHFIRKVMLHKKLKGFSAQAEFHIHKDFLKDFCKDYGHLDVLLLDENEKVIDNLYEKEIEDSLHFSFIRVFLIQDSDYRIALLTSTKYLEKLLFENTGMGNTGESYLVSEDYKLITKSRFFPDKQPASIAAHTFPVQEALQGRTGAEWTKDYRGVEVLSAYTTISHKNLKWVLLSEMDVSEAMQPVLQLRMWILVSTLLVLFVVLLVTLYLSQSISKPIRAVSKEIADISQGRVPERLEPPFPNNEMGRMKEALNRLIDSFHRITVFAAQIGDGDLHVSFKPMSESDTLGKSLLTMRDQLRAYQEREKNLSKQKALLLLEGEENERRRLARDLHDGLGQWLTGLKLKIASVEMPPKEKEELKSLLSETINEVRRITTNVMPSVLVDFGLDAGLRQLVATVQKHTGMQLHYTYHPFGYLNPFPFEVIVTLYRIAQEGLNNISKHAQATEVVIELREEAAAIGLEIKDNGIGFSTDASKNKGNGLINMEERVKLLNGIFAIQSNEAGTLLKVQIPLK